MQQHMALYGNTGIPRVYCVTCRSWAFVMDEMRQCCNRPVTLAITKTRRISQPEGRRRRPSRQVAKRLLEAWHYRCAYCGQLFGTWVLKQNKPTKLLVCWDHVIPYMYAQHNRSVNFLPSCRPCNGWKSSRIFRTLEEVRTHVTEQWKRAGAIVPAVWDDLSSQSVVAGILQPDMPMAGMEPTASASRDSAARQRAA